MTVVDAYVIQIVYDDSFDNWDDLGNLYRLIAEAEENLTDLLPPGYKAVIRRWNDDEGLPREEDDE